MTKESFVKAVCKVLPENLWVACIGQALMESNIDVTDLAKLHNNFWGMKFRTDNDFKKCFEGVNYSSVDYKTDSEPTGSAVFLKFPDEVEAVRGWRAFLNRLPYAEKDLTSSESLITSISKTWCAAGFEDSWAKAHGGLTYDKYIINNLFPKAKDLIKQFGSAPTTDTSFWAKYFPSERKLYVIGEPSGTAKSTISLIDIFETADAVDALSFAKKEGAGMWSIAASGELPPKEKQDPVPPIPPVVTKFVVALDSGHSLRAPGARSTSKKVREEVVVEAQTKKMKELFEAQGVQTTWVNPDPDDLVEVGKSGWGKPQVMLSMHLNSYDGNDNPYCAVLTDPNASTETKQFASDLCAVICESLKGTPQECPMYRGEGGFKGVMFAELSVINTSLKDPDGNPPIHALLETFFVNKFDNEQQCIDVCCNNVAPAVVKFTVDFWNKKHVAPPPSDVYLKAVRTRTQNSGGLENIKLTMEGAGLSWTVNSGLAGKQVFLKGGTGEQAGTYYPAPQGVYSVEDFQWADGIKDNWSGSLGEGLGPVFVPFNPTFSTARSSMGFHCDQNRSTSPGSAGCIVFATLEDLKSFIAAMRKYDPRKFVIDWGL